jgi:hypothetical protein
VTVGTSEYQIEASFKQEMNANDVGVGMAQSVNRRAAGWETGTRFPVRKVFSILQGQDRLWSPLSLPSNSYWGLFPEIKRREREDDNLPPFSTDVKNGRFIPPLTRKPSWHIP